MRFLSVRNTAILFLLLLVVLRWNYFIGAAELLVLYSQLLASDTNFALGLLNLELADTLFSVVILPVALLCVVLLRKNKFLTSKITFNSLVVIILLTFFFLAPAVSTFHPEFHQNLALTIFRVPMSEALIIYSGKQEKSDIKEKFLALRDIVVKEPVGENFLITSPESSVGEAGQKVNKVWYLLGTDQYGRDIFSRVVYGARISLFVGMLAVIISFLLGFILGFSAGYPGGIIDIVLNRMSDIFLSFPMIFLIILVLAFFGNSLPAVILILGISGWMSMFKIVRTEIISIKRKDYFITAAQTGAGFFELMFKEALPVVAVPVIVNLIFQFANVIIAEAALSYLGLGAGTNYPSWGSMIYNAQSYLSQAWWMVIPPGLLLIVTLYTVYNAGKIYSRKNLRKGYD